MTDRTTDLIGHILAKPNLAYDIDPSVLPDRLSAIHAAVVELHSTTGDVAPTSVGERSGADVQWLADCALGYSGSFSGALAAVTADATRRRMRDVGVELQRAAKEADDPDAAISEALAALVPKSRTGMRSIGAARIDRLESITDAMFAVSIEGAEDVLFAESDFVVIGARPGIGKTVLALQNALRWAKHGTPTAMFSFEMGDAQLFDRIVAGRLPMTVGRLRRGVKDEVRDHIATATADLADVPFFIDDTSPTFDSCLLSCRAFAARGGKVVVLDYFGLAVANPDWKELTRCSMALKRLARQTGLIVITLSQLSRDVAKESRRATIADLRGTGSLEQDADTVGVMGKPDDALLETWRSERWILPDGDLKYLDFDKSRHSRPACVPLEWRGDEMRLAPVDREGGFL